MKIGHRVTLTKRGYEQRFVGKHGSVDAVIVGISGVAIKVLRDGYKQPLWFHRDFWRKIRDTK